VLAEGPSVPRRHRLHRPASPRNPPKGVPLGRPFDATEQSVPGEVRRDRAITHGAEPGLTYPQVGTASPDRQATPLVFGVVSTMLGNNPDRDRLRLFIQGEGGPLFGIGDRTPSSGPRAPYPCPCLRGLYRGKADPCLRCAPRFPRKEKWLSTCPTRVPASEFSQRGGSRPLLETCAAAPPVEGGRLSVSPTRVPASEFLYEGEGKPLS